MASFAEVNTAVSEESINEEDKRKIYEVRTHLVFLFNFFK